MRPGARLWSVAWTPVCVFIYCGACVHQTALTSTFSPLFVYPLSLLPTLQLLVKTDKPTACCHMELINRMGGNKRQFNFNTNKETFQIPPYKTPGGTQSLRVFALKQIYGEPSLASSIAAVTPGPVSRFREGQGWNHTGPGPSKAGLVFLAS